MDEKLVEDVFYEQAKGNLVDYKEFIGKLVEKSRQEVATLLRKNDSSDDGKITGDFMQNMGEAGRIIMTDIDKNDDGSIDLEAFCEHLTITSGINRS